MKIYYNEKNIIVEFALLYGTEGISLDVPSDKSAVEYIAEAMNNGTFINKYHSSIDNSDTLHTGDYISAIRSMARYAQPDVITVRDMSGSDKQIIYAQDLLNDAYRYGCDNYIYFSHKDNNYAMAERYNCACERFKNICNAGLGRIKNAANVIDYRIHLHGIIDWLARKNLKDNYYARSCFDISAEDVLMIETQ